jgi:hypothetical protein
LRRFLIRQENFENTNFSKKTPNAFETKRKVVAKGRFSLTDFLPGVRKLF